MELPITDHFYSDHARMLNQTVHGKPIFGGYVSRQVHDYYLDSAFRQFVGIDGQFRYNDILPPLDFQQVLSCCNIRYVVAYKGGDRKRVLAFAQTLFPDPTSVVYDDSELTAYLVKPTKILSPAPLIWVGDGWYSPETDGQHRWRWSRGDSNLELSSSQPVSVQLSFDSATLQGQTELRVEVNGQLVKSVEISSLSQHYDLGTLDLPAGRSTIKLRGSAAPISPAAIGGAKDDTRKLAFVVQNLSLIPLSK
jgi:hypothetical protein